MLRIFRIYRVTKAFVHRYYCSTYLLAVGWSSIVAWMRGGDGPVEGTGEGRGVGRGEAGGGGAQTQSFS